MVSARYNVSMYGKEAFGNRIVETTLFKERLPASIRQTALVKRSPPGSWGKLGYRYRPTADLASIFRKDDIFVLIDVMVR
jgi:hypothetical protein